MLSSIFENKGNIYFDFSNNRTAKVYNAALPLHPVLTPCGMLLAAAVAAAAPFHKYQCPQATIASRFICSHFFPLLFVPLLSIH